MTKYTCNAPNRGKPNLQRYETPCIEHAYALQSTDHSRHWGRTTQLVFFFFKLQNRNHTHKVGFHHRVGLVLELVVEGVQVKEGPPSRVVEPKARVAGLWNVDLQPQTDKGIIMKPVDASLRSPRAHQCKSPVTHHTPMPQLQVKCRMCRQCMML